MRRTAITRLIPMALAVFALVTSVQAESFVANFDSLLEGGGDLAFTDGGITFSNLISANSFSIDQADGDLSGPDFSP